MKAFALLLLIAMPAAADEYIFDWTGTATNLATQQTVPLSVSFEVDPTSITNASLNAFLYQMDATIQNLTVVFNGQTLISNGSGTLAMGGDPENESGSEWASGATIKSGSLLLSTETDNFCANCSSLLEMLSSWNGGSAAAGGFPYQGQAYGTILSHKFTVAAPEPPVLPLLALGLLLLGTRIIRRKAS